MDDTQSMSTAAASDSPPPAAHPWPTASDDWLETLAASGARIGRYTVLERIGGGGMGVVFAAHDAELDRKVAIKLLRDAVASEMVRARIVREARAMAQLSHPHVAQVFEVGEYLGTTFIAMELVAGMTLRQWRRQADRSWREVLEAYLQAGRGLAAAHAKGLVHRDFKPDNAMIGADGRVRVLDFGLARVDAGPSTDDGASDERPRSATDSEGEPGPLDSPLTRHGAVLGTLAYMPPEQRRGDVADARSDQLSFCVSLFEALYGKLPSASEPAAPPDVPSRTPVPDRLRRALQRGLASDPDARWPSMDALLEALAAAPSRKRMAAVVLASTAPIVALAVAYGLPRSEAEALCTGATEAIAEVWHDERREAVQEAFLGSSVSFAEATLERIVPRLDGWATEWADAHRKTCEATRIRDERSEAQLDASMACLSRGRYQLAATLAVLERPDLDVVQNATKLVDDLPSPAACLDADALTHTAPAPDDPSLAARVEEIRERLADARARARAGHLTAARELAIAAVTAAEATGHDPIRAQAWLELGDIEGEIPVPEHVATLQKAISLAEAIGDDELLAEAWLNLANHDRAREHDWLQHAEAAVARVGSPPRLRLRLLGTQSLTHMMSSEPDGWATAVAENEQAIALASELYGPESRAAAASTTNLGLMYYSRGMIEEGLPLLEAGVRKFEVALGPEHLQTAAATNILAEVVDVMGRHREAVVLYERVIAIYDAALGPSASRTAIPLANASVAQRLLGEHDRSIAFARRSVEVTLPADRLRYLQYLGQAYLAAGRAEEAIPVLRQAIAMGDPEPRPFEQRPWVTAMITLGRALLEQGRHDEAESIMERGLGLAIEPGDRMDAHEALGQLELRRGRPEAALEHFEAALRAIEGTDQHLEAENLGDVRFGLARALVAAGGDRSRALAEAERARELLRGVDGSERARAQIDAWLRETAAEPDPPRR